MKGIISISVITFILLCLSGQVKSQCAVYFCPETGAIGYAYGLSYDEVFDKAKEACINYGGTSPQLVVSTEQEGYGAIALGEDEYGNRVIGASCGASTLEEAKELAIQKCEEYDGTDVYISETWYDE